MPFREDEEARVALVDSLERENEQLREELAEAKAAAAKTEEKAEEAEAHAEPEPPKPPKSSKPHEPAKPAKPAKSPKPASAAAAPPWSRWIVGGGFALGIGAVLFLLVPRCFHHLKHSNGSIRDFAWLGDELAVKVEYVGKTNTTTEIETFDLATGARRGSVSLGITRALTFPHDGTRTWVSTKHDGLELVDVHAPAILMTASELDAKIPELRNGYHLRSRDSYQLKDGSIANRSNWFPPEAPITLADGTLAWIDTTPALVRAPSGPPQPRLGYTCRFYDSASCEQRRCFAWDGVDGSTALQLAVAPAWVDDKTPSRTEVRNGLQVTISSGRNAPPLASPDAAKLIKAAFVERLDRPCAVELGGGVLVRHQKSVVDKGVSVSLLDAAGKIAWSIPMTQLADDADMPIGAIVKPDVIYLLLGDRWGESIGLEHFKTRHLEVAHVSPAGKVLRRFTLW